MRTSLIALLCSVFLSLSLCAQGAHHLYVDTNASAGGDGSLWSDAFESLGDALAAAGPGTQIWVAEGTYAGGFVIPAGVELLGGFRNGDTRASQRDPWGQKTILDGGDIQRVLDLGDKCLVDGFVVRNGNATSPGGGGALADGTSPTVRRCVFTKNRNTTGRGSTIAVRDGGRPIFSHCILVNNLAGLGHVLDVDAAGGTYDHLTIYQNHDNGFHFQNGADPVITNCIFSRNFGRGICDFERGPINVPVLENNLFWNNGISAYYHRGADYSDAATINGLSYASGNLIDDPSFVRGPSANLRLKADSAAIDESQPSSGFDIGGNLRVLDGDQDGTAAPDIGAWEYTALELELGGTISSGGTLRVTFKGSPGHPALLVLGAYSEAGTWFGPYGTVHLDLGQPIVIGLAALVPAVVDIPIPMSIGPGTMIGLQAVSATVPTGFLSRPYDVLIR